MNNIIILILTAILMSGCSLFNHKDDPIEIQTRVEPIQILHPPLPDALVWEEVKWKILTVEQMRALVKKVDSGELKERDAVFFAITPEGYESLSVNMAEIIRLIEGQKSVIMYYRTTVPEQIFLPEE